MQVTEQLTSYPYKKKIVTETELASTKITPAVSRKPDTALYPKDRPCQGSMPSSNTVPLAGSSENTHRVSVWHFHELQSICSPFF